MPLASRFGNVARVAYIALLTPAFIGHLNPMIVLGRALMRRRHRVTMIAPLDGEERIRRGGLEFIPIGEEELPRGDWDRRTAELGELAGFAASRYCGKWLGDCARGTVRDLPKIIERERFDGLVMDQIYIGAEAVCQVAGLPVAGACNALALNPDWSVPPGTSPWPYRDSFWAKIRNVFGYVAINSTGMSIVREVMKYRLKHRLGWMSPTHVNQLRPCVIQIAQQPAFFDFPREYLPKNFHYTAPWKEPSEPSKVDFPWERLDGRPLIYASLGTLQNRLEYIFQTIAEACAGLDAQLVIALGRPGATPPENLAGNPIVVGYAPQFALLQRATLLITHAGLNTSLEAMMLGLPMIALPITNDQPGVASRIEYLGIGEKIPLKKLTPHTLRNAVERVLKNPSYRQKAQHWATELKKINGPEFAADLIEKAFSPGLSDHPKRSGDAR